jgi:membrane protein implicated in regulation of membrane protease activity
MRTLRKTPPVVSNAPNVVGKRAVVIVAVGAGPGQRGQVRVGTEYWSARSADESPIADGTTVEVAAIDGVALVVRPV